MISLHNQKCQGMCVCVLSAGDFYVTTVNINPNECIIEICVYGSEVTYANKIVWISGQCPESGREAETETCVDTER